MSIVTVFRRDFDELEETLECLASIPDLPIEWVIVEGDSEDWAHSASIRSRAQSRGVRLKWCLHPDKGIYDAMNRGLIASQGEWLWFINAGDAIPRSLSLKTLLNDLNDAMSANWLVGAVRISSNDGAVQYISRYRSATGLMSGRAPICHQGVLVRRSAFALVGLFDTSYRISADYKSFLLLSQHGEPHVLDREIAEFKLGGASTVQGGLRERENLRAREQVLRRSLATRAHDHLRCLWRWAQSRQKTVLTTPSARPAPDASHP